MFLTIIGILIVAIIFLIAYALFESQWFEVTEPELEIHGLHPAFDGYRIAHISDIHMDSSMTKERLTNIAHRTIEQNPDLIVITGDFVSYKVKYATSDLRDALAEFKAPDGVIAILGNHDHLAGVDAVRDVLDEVGIRELRNDCITVAREGGQFYLAGVDDVSAQKARLDILLDKVPDDAPAILLAHEPDYADVVAATSRFEAQLSGHTHGGQIQVPVIGALFGPEHGHRYEAGLYDVDNGLQLYVSRGVGTVHLPLRFNCRPEIAIHTLRPAPPK